MLGVMLGCIVTRLASVYYGVKNLVHRSSYAMNFFKLNLSLDFPLSCIFSLPQYVCFLTDTK